MLEDKTPESKRNNKKFLEELTDLTKKYGLIVVGHSLIVDYRLEGEYRNNIEGEIDFIRPCTTENAQALMDLCVKLEDAPQCPKCGEQDRIVHYKTYFFCDRCTHRGPERIFREFN